MMNGMLLEGEVLSCRAKSTMAAIEDEATFDDLQQFEEEEQDVRNIKALVISLRMK
jgi:hypothetical protein